MGNPGWSTQYLILVILGANGAGRFQGLCRHSTSKTLTHNGRSRYRLYRLGEKTPLEGCYFNLAKRAKKLESVLRLKRRR